MPTFKTALAAKQDSNNPRTRANGFETSAGLQVLTATYTTVGTEAADDVISIADLPVGAVLIPSLSRVISEGIGGTGATAATIGDASDVDRYSATAVALTAAGIVAVTPTAAIALTPHVITEATKRITATLALASGSITAAKKIRFELVYKMPGH